MEFVRLTDFDQINGTVRQGEIHVRYEELVKRLGEPANGGTEETDAEWWLKFEDGTIVTIYNYKDGKNWRGGRGLPVDAIGFWHIGGNCSRAAQLIIELFK